MEQAKKALLTVPEGEGAAEFSERAKEIPWFRKSKGSLMVSRGCRAELLLQLFVRNCSLSLRPCWKVKDSSVMSSSSGILHLLCALSSLSHSPSVTFICFIITFLPLTSCILTWLPFKWLLDYIYQFPPLVLH